MESVRERHTEKVTVEIKPGIQYLHIVWTTVVGKNVVLVGCLAGGAEGLAIVQQECQMEGQPRNSLPEAEEPTLNPGKNSVVATSWSVPSFVAPSHTPLGKGEAARRAEKVQKASAESQEAECGSG